MYIQTRLVPFPGHLLASKLVWLFLVLHVGSSWIVWQQIKDEEELLLVGEEAGTTLDSHLKKTPPGPHREWLVVNLGTLKFFLLYKGRQYLCFKHFIE